MSKKEVVVVSAVLFFVLSCVAYFFMSPSLTHKKEEAAVVDNSIVAAYAGCPVTLTPSSVLFFHCKDGTLIKAMDKFKEKITISLLLFRVVI